MKVPVREQKFVCRKQRTYYRRMCWKIVRRSGNDPGFLSKDTALDIQNNGNDRI